MPTITVRKLPDDVVDLIKRTAAENGRSMEEEVRATLLERYLTKGAVLEGWRRMRARARRRIPAEEAERIMDEVSRWEGAVPDVEDVRVRHDAVRVPRRRGRDPE